jgi:hypothetical protein
MDNGDTHLDCHMETAITHEQDDATRLFQLFASTERAQQSSHGKSNATVIYLREIGRAMRQFQLECSVLR